MKAIQMARQKNGSKKRSKINGGISFIICLLFLAGCATTDVVYVPPGDAVKLRETVKNVKVWIKTTERIVLPGKTDLHEGWF